MIIYQLSQVKQIYGSRCVLDIDFLEIEKGKIHALLGPNGSGKTTLLNILGFLEKPAQGNVHFNGSPVFFNESKLQQLRRTVVMVQQNPILFSTSVYKNLEFGLKIRKVSKLSRQKIIDEALELVGLRHLILAPAHKLSGGETQRVVLARALALSPEVILCDEPTASVDLENQFKISLLLKQINREKGITLLFTSHDKRQAASLPDQRIFLEQGKTSRHSYENVFPIHLFNEAIPLINYLKSQLEKAGKSKVHNNEQRFRIDPRTIAIGSKNTNELSVEGVDGKITRISQDGDLIRVAVNCGVRLTVLMSIADYQRNSPMVGDTVVVSVPESSLSYLQ